MIEPIEGESFGDYYARISGSSGVDRDPNSVGNKFANLFDGRVDTARDNYNQWYNEQSAAKKAQADYEYTRLLNQTKYQDEVQALRAAGLNPYFVIANGGASPGNMSYSSSERNERGSSSKSSGNSKAVIAAIGVFVAALVKALI